MSMLRKLRRQKANPITPRKSGLTIKKVTDLILRIDDLKKRGVLHTTDQGHFYIYRTIVEMGHDPQAFCKNLYIYGRNTNLLAKGQTLTLIDLEDDKKKTIIATIQGDTVTLHPAELS